MTLVGDISLLLLTSRLTFCCRQVEFHLAIGHDELPIEAIMQVASNVTLARLLSENSQHPHSIEASVAMAKFC